MTGSPTQTTASPRLRIETVATRDATRFLSEMIQTFCQEGLGLSAEAPDTVRVRLAVTEALTNVARYGYPEDEAGPLVLEVHRDGAWLVTSVSDFGVPFDPTGCGTAQVPGSAELAEGGYGLGIIRAVMDDLQHEYSKEHGNRFLMKKRLWD